ncbi:MAG: hypothetical protein JAY99_16905 [Candidatus Thiodiazotropha lotti]|uniref:Uncharacterized protein n=1 Tax=Candidatus Thiodiazotropha endoloripes TaxID=1818881 RepID=A0A1E2UQ14_9GAMM|nr:hypothetical protein [Candidatus Thiodiazotropha endoloripes]MCG7899324.1 hypothetical protein [Candidatus Thiodiazotropha weberae]MCG7993645.1 hypothetical protein [Candidatus Thiodiazotropha lotti]MCG7903825.1 hypothetical protein [Candidatus Thiodiazotropha weberae]MCG7914541.1 hypothetical protein [Candidatus Thiodiazotropha weberae]MCG8001201.1 hypothetical protein [Candidatus Thiodiazotropha lotti]
MEQVPNSAFSIRRLNPFNGLLQVFQLDTARALSANGQVWEIQVLSDSPQGLWANTPLGAQQYFTFGLWSETSGLKQVPVNPLFDIRTMIAASDRLIESLQPVLSQLPFPMADRYEQWLLDETDQQPLALLRSCRTENEMALTDSPAKWIAAEADDCSFISSYLNQRGLPDHDGDNPRVHASTLEAEVRHRAGSKSRTAWFYRNGENEMVPYHENQPPDLEFPTLLLAESGYDAKNAPLIEDYIAWKAPQLLMLPYISGGCRERLEQLAVKQPEQIDRFWPLYPEIHNKDLLKRARVEARIRSANRD